MTFIRNDVGTVAEIQVTFLRRTVTGTRNAGVDHPYTYVGSATCGTCHAG